MRREFLGLLFASLAITGCGREVATARAVPNEADELHAAMRDLTRVIVYDILNPPQASRVYSYASIAAYEVIRQTTNDHHSFSGQLRDFAPVPAPPAGELSLPLAGVHAFLTVGRTMTFSRARTDSLRTALHERFRQKGVATDVVERSVAYGEAVAKHVLDWSAKDNYKESRGYPKFTVTAERGRWTPTPPGYMDAVEPNWAILRPLVMDSASHVRAEAAHPFDSTEGSAFFREAREVYEVSKKLTDDERALVAFWDDNSYVMHVRGHAMFATKKATPGGHWMNIAATAAHASNANLVESAEAYARTAIALGEGFLTCWDEKFRSNVIRPETYITRYIDDTWQPLLQTPPFPEYTSGHSVISTAAATVLTDQFGENFSFTDSTEVEYGLTARSFKSFKDAAAEAAMSRLYGGIHYRRAVEQGAAQGRRVGELVVQRVRTHGSTPVATSH
jgi:hypothetical protein